MRYGSFLYLTFLIFSAPLDARIHEIKRMWEVLNHIPYTPARILVIFDIDNTLLEPSTSLGSDQWFSSMMEKNGSSKDHHAALQTTLPLYLHINHHIELVPTESDLVDCVNEIRALCDHAICLTARSSAQCEKTLHELHRHNLKFHIPDFERIDFNLPHMSIYKDGVFFCNGSSNKVHILREFLNATNYNPEIIIVIDDKEKNLHLIANMITEPGIKLLLLRYAGCDAKVDTFDHHKAEKELVAFLEQYPFTP